MDINFDWNSMNNGQDPFEQKNTYAVDERFYSLKKDEKGNGVAVIRFLPSEVHENGTMSTIKRLFKYNVRSKTSKRFIAEWSPSSIGLKDPIQEKWQKLWNAGQKDEARRYARSTRYIANIKVLKDPAAPENEGKIFLLDMSQTLCDKIKSIIQPSEQDIAIGTKPKNLFDPLNGYSFKLVATIGANGFTEYSKSEALSEPSSIYKDIKEAVDDIKTNAYKLSDWDKPEAYPTYEELQQKLDDIDNEAPTDSHSGVETTKVDVSVQTNTAQQEKPKEKVEPAKVADDLDNLLMELAK